MADSTIEYKYIGRYPYVIGAIYQYSIVHPFKSVGSFLEIHSEECNKCLLLGIDQPDGSVLFNSMSSIFEETPDPRFGNIYLSKYNPDHILLITKESKILDDDDRVINIDIDNNDQGDEKIQIQLYNKQNNLDLTNYYRPDIDKFPIIKNANDYAKTIRFIKDKWAIIPYSNNIKLLFQGKTFIATFEHNYIYIGTGPDHNLEMRTEISSKSANMYIGHVRGDKNYTGTWIMNVANTLIYSLGFRSASLTDKSTLLCNINNKYSELIYLRMFEGKLTSWYENFGYAYNYDFSDKHKMGQVRIFPMSIIKYHNTTDENITPHLFDVDAINMKYEIYNHISVDTMQDIIIRLSKIINDTTYETLGPFMLDLWKNNCDLYSYMVHILSSIDIPYGDFILSYGMGQGRGFKGEMYRTFD